MKLTNQQMSIIRNKIVNELRPKFQARVDVEKKYLEKEAIKIVDSSQQLSSISSAFDSKPQRYSLYFSSDEMKELYETVFGKVTDRYIGCSQFKTHKELAEKLITIYVEQNQQAHVALATLGGRVDEEILMSMVDTKDLAALIKTISAKFS